MLLPQEYENCGNILHYKQWQKAFATSKTEGFLKAMVFKDNTSDMLFFRITFFYYYFLNDFSCCCQPKNFG